MSHIIAAIDVHKKLLVVVIAGAAKPDVVLQSRRFGAGAAELLHLPAWLRQYGVLEAVMESAARHGKPVWMELEPHLRLHLAQAQSNKAPKGRKSNLAGAKRLLRRFLAGELMLSFIPEPEQRSWRMVTRARLQLIRERVQVQNQIESLLEEGRILRAMAKGETNPETLAALGGKHLQCGLPSLVDALTGSMGDIHRQLPGQHLDRIERIGRQIDELNKLAAAQMQKYQNAVTRLIGIPGIGAEAAQEIRAGIGPEAAAFPSAGQLASWTGVCPGSNESAGENHSGRSAKGNRFCCVKPPQPPSGPTIAICNRCSSAW